MDPRPAPSQRTNLLWVILAVVVANLAIAAFVLRSRQSAPTPTPVPAATPGSVPAQPVAATTPNSSLPPARESVPPPPSEPLPASANGVAAPVPQPPPPAIPATPAAVLPNVPPVASPPPIAPVLAVATTKAGAGQVRGWVALTGTPPPEKEIAAIRADRNCGALQPGPVFTRNYLVGTNSGLGNVFVRIASRRDGPIPNPAKDKAVLLDQVGCLYEPYMVGVMTNQPLVLRNSDPVMHNVNCTSKAGNPVFNIAQTRQGQEDTKFFTKAELFVTLQCNVHPWMFAYVGVVEHPYFAVTAPDGSFELPPGLPAGNYTLEFTHRKAGTMTASVELPAAGGAELRVAMAAK